MIPLCVPNISGNEGAYLAECVSSTFVSTVGPFVSRFEEMIAKAAGTEQAVATSSGTTGLHAALMTAGVRRDDLVICPSLTFIASANAIAHCGAIPWLLDIDSESWTLDAEAMKAVLANHTVLRAGERIHKDSGRRVSAVLPVFTLGLPADMDRIVQTAREAGLAVVVDAAAGLGALYKGRPSGDLAADLTMYSFNGNKTVTAGGGGAVVGRDGEMLARMRHLTTTARVGAEYDHDVVGYNYRMTNLQAAVGCAQMERLTEFLAAKHRIADCYDKALTGKAGYRAFPQPNWATSARWFAGFLVDRPDGAEISAALRAHLRQVGIDARPFWKPMHMQAPYRDAPRENLPVSEYLWQRIVTLPCSTHLTDKEQERVVEAVLDWTTMQRRAA